MIPHVIDNQQHRLADVLNELLARCAGGPVDVATAYFAVSGYRLVRERLRHAGAFRLLIGAEPKAGADVGLRPDRRAEYLKRLQGDLAAEPFSEATLRLVEELIAFLRAEKVQVRLFDILVSTDVLSEGQNLQDCGTLVNYDLTWNPIRLVQRNGRIDRIGSPHAEIGIYNMFPEEELEELLHLIERLTSRISTIDELGLLDASVLGEVVHPRTFNTLRRIREEDGAVLDEEEARAELAGPEMLLRHLKEMLHREDLELICFEYVTG